MARMINKKKASNLFKAHKESILIAFGLLSISSIVTVRFIPLLGTMNETPLSRPPILLLALVGTILIALSALFLRYIAGFVGMTSSWLLLAVIYNSLIVITKFILAPDALYGQTIQLSGGLSEFDPNNAGGYIYLAAILFAFYLLVVYAAYKYYSSKTTSRPKISAPSVTNTNRLIGIAVLIIGLGLFASGSSLLFMPLLLIIPAWEYTNYAVFQSGVSGLLILAATILALFLGARYFATSAQAAIRVKDATILASVLWISISLLALYHVLWVIYMTILLTLWPFKTIAPSSK